MSPAEIAPATRPAADIGFPLAVADDGKPGVLPLRVKHREQRRITAHERAG